MSPARRAKLSRIGAWACIGGAVLFIAISVASSYCWLKCWCPVAGRRLCAGAERGTFYIFVSKDWPDRTPHPAWYAAADTLPSYPYQWWGWFWPWRPLTSGSAWFRQLAFPSWLPVPIFALSGVALWRVHTNARRDLLAKCHRCGYDRAGLAAHAKCPECGKGLG